MFVDDVKCSQATTADCCKFAGWQSWHSSTTRTQAGSTGVHVDKKAVLSQGNRLMRRAISGSFGEDILLRMRRYDQYMTEPPYFNIRPNI